MAMNLSKDFIEKDLKRILGVGSCSSSANEKDNKERKERHRNAFRKKSPNKIHDNHDNSNAIHSNSKFQQTSHHNSSSSCISNKAKERSPQHARSHSRESSSNENALGSNFSSLKRNNLQFRRESSPLQNNLPQYGYSPTRENYSRGSGGSQKRFYHNGPSRSGQRDTPPKEGKTDSNVEQELPEDDQAEFVDYVNDNFEKTKKKKKKKRKKDGGASGNTDEKVGCVDFQEGSDTETIKVKKQVEAQKPKTEKKKKRNPGSDAAPLPSDMQAAAADKRKMSNAENGSTSVSIIKNPAKMKEAIDNMDLNFDDLDDCRPPPEILAELEEQCIHRLKRKSLRFPKARFFCRLCEYHCDNVSVCQRHIKDSRHQKAKTNRDLELTLQNLPGPQPCHVEVLTELLLSVEKEVGLSDEEITQRQALVDELNHLVEQKLPGCQVRLYGSSLNKFGLKDSDVNIDLMVPSKKNPAEMLMAMFDLLKSYSKVEKVESDFGAKIPSIFFMDKKYSLKCAVNLNNHLAYKTTQLLLDYISIDQRVRPLGIAFRYWAKLCMIDEQSRGTMPSYSFALMLIYFLQQHKSPVLPVLHELKEGPEDSYLSPNKLNGLWKVENTQSLGELWIQLFRFYSISFKMGDMVVCIRQHKPLTRSDKHWSSRKIAVEDPFSTKRNLTRSISNQILSDYVIDRFRSAYKYFGIPQLKNGPLFDKLLTQDFERNLSKKLGDCAVSNSRLLMEVFENIAAGKTKPPCTEKSQKDAENNNKVKSNTDNDLKPRDDQFENDLEACEQQFNRNFGSRSSSPINHTFEEDDSLNCSRDDADSELSESTPRGADDDSEQENCIPTSLREALDGEADISSLSAEGSDFQINLPSEIFDDTNTSINDKKDSISSVDKEKESQICVESNDSPNTVSKIITLDEEQHLKKEESKPTDADKEHSSTDVSNDKKVDDVASSKNGSEKSSKNVSCSLPPHILEKLAILLKEDLFFKFDKAILTNGKRPAIMCGICQKEGHLKQECPEEKLPKPEPLPAMPKQFLDSIDHICVEIKRDFSPKSREIEERKSILEDLQQFIRQLYPDAELELFGSSCNGFGFTHSDLDICLTFAKNKTGEELKFVKIIETLAERLKKHKGLYNVIAITTAKVPIVKFTHRKSHLDGDISLYNTLAQHNTRMLNMYAEIDNRVKLLGYTMKYFAKICDIGDASRGSLSSYAYTLMVIYFLQQRKPPVIPVLQEINDKNKAPEERIVDGWNAWFYDDLKNLQRIWPYYSKNKESAGELWIGLLRFYTEEFNFKEYVISIRQLKPLTRFEKLWNSKCIAIEDPFDLQHNLGAGVSRKMNSYIMKAFLKGRSLFGNPVYSVPVGYYNLKEYLFDPDLLTDGLPPNDRGCRQCGKIGHVVKDCPRRRNKGNKEKSNKENSGPQKPNKESNNSKQKNIGSTVTPYMPITGDAPKTPVLPTPLLLSQQLLLHIQRQQIQEKNPNLLSQSPGGQNWSSAKNSPQNLKVNQIRPSLISGIVANLQQGQSPHGPNKNFMNPSSSSAPLKGSNSQTYSNSNISIASTLGNRSQPFSSNANNNSSISNSSSKPQNFKIGGTSKLPAECINSRDTKIGGQNNGQGKSSHKTSSQGGLNQTQAEDNHLNHLQRTGLFITSSQLHNVANPSLNSVMMMARPQMHSPLNDQISSKKAPIQHTPQHSNSPARNAVSLGNIIEHSNPGGNQRSQSEKLFSNQPNQLEGNSASAPLYACNPSMSESNSLSFGSKPTVIRNASSVSAPPGFNMNFSIPYPPRHLQAENPPGFQPNMNITKKEPHLASGPSSSQGHTSQVFSSLYHPQQGKFPSSENIAIVPPHNQPTPPPFHNNTQPFPPNPQFSQFPPQFPYPYHMYSSISIPQHGQMQQQQQQTHQQPSKSQLQQSLPSAAVPQHSPQQQQPKQQQSSMTNRTYAQVIQSNSGFTQQPMQHDPSQTSLGFYLGNPYHSSHEHIPTDNSLSNQMGVNHTQGLCQFPRPITNSCNQQSASGNNSALGILNSNSLAYSHSSNGNN